MPHLKSVKRREALHLYAYPDSAPEEVEQNGTIFFRKKSAHIGLARDAAERRKFDSFRFFIPGWCQFKPQIFGKGIFAGLLYNAKYYCWGQHSVQRAPLSTNGEPGRPKPPQI